MLAFDLPDDHPLKRWQKMSSEEKREFADFLDQLINPSYEIRMTIQEIKKEKKNDSD
jgi:hypothetical protein